MQDSHLVPRSIYKTLSAPGQPNPNPVLVRSGSAFQTSKQAKTHLLCSTCEQLLNKRGEKAVIPFIAKDTFSSPIYELVTKLPLLRSENGVPAYSATENTGFSVDELAHFAMGIFWKASVHSWHNRDGEPLIKLGPYEKPLREYVRAQEEKPFPSNFSLMVIILPPPKIPLLIGVPIQGPSEDWHRNFRFYIPGVQFVLSVGKTVDREFCFVSNPLHPIWVHDIEHLVNAIPARMYARGGHLDGPHTTTWGALVKRGR